MEDLIVLDFSSIPLKSNRKRLEQLALKIGYAIS